MKDLWMTLKERKKPLVMYGMGNGADKITDEVERRGLAISDYFASDGFVRGQFFRGKKVLTWEEIRKKYSDFIILVGFASALPEVMERIEALDREYELYIPDVPVAGRGIFDAPFYEKYRFFFQEAREIWADDASLQIYDGVIAFKLTGEYRYLKGAVSDREEVYQKLLCAERYRSCADLGAYNGDSVREFIRYFPHVQKIYSMEPDRHNFRKLTEFLTEKDLSFVTAYPYAAWKEDGQHSFNASGNRNASLNGGGTQSVEVRKLDTLLQGAPVDYIKYDVEGSEYEALWGSYDTIARFTPDLMVSVYHRNEDIFRLPLFVRTLSPKYRLYLRRFPGFPAWDVNLYALTEK